MKQRLRGRFIATASTLLVATAGGVLAAALSLPVAWLLGPVIVVAIASVAGLDTRIPQSFRQVAFFVLGIQAGSGVTPEVLGQLAYWPISFAVQMVGVGAVIWVTYAYLRRWVGWDHDTALFASLPGALAFVMAAASETRADIGRIAIVQTARLLLLIGALVPVLAWLESGPDVDAIERSVLGSPSEYAVLAAVCGATAFLGWRLKIPGGMMLGALIGSAALHVTKASDVLLPAWIAIPSLILLGCVIGSRLQGIERSELLRLLPVSLVCFVIGLGLSAVAGAVTIASLGIEPGKVALAYAPGALEALTVLAFQFAVDPAYVAAHHVIRFMGIAFAVPFLAKRSVRMTQNATGLSEDPPTGRNASGVDRGKD